MEIVVSAMDAVGVRSVLVVELAAADFMNDPEPLATMLDSGALSYRHPFSEYASANQPDRFAYVYHFDPFDPQLADTVTRAAATRGVKATRSAPGAYPELGAAFATGQYSNYFEQLQKHEMPVFLFLGDKVSALEPYAAAFPDLNFIIGHWGFPMPTQGSRISLDSFAGVLDLGRYPNVYLQWCRGPRASQSPYPHRDLDPFIQRSLDRFGPSRIMWASDALPTPGHTSWADEIYHLRDSAMLGADEVEQVFGRTARTLLRWWPADQ